MIKKMLFRLFSPLQQRAPLPLPSALQQWSRSIRVKVRDNDLERALGLLQSRLRSSGIERLIKDDQITHVKNSEKRVLAKKNLKRRLDCMELARKLKTILLKKLRGQ